VLEAFARSPAATRTATATSSEQLRILSGFRNAEGQPCQVVEQTVLISGQRVRATGTMCQQPDGRWVLTR
jgi:surface antigen